MVVSTNPGTDNTDIGIDCSTNGGNTGTGNGGNTGTSTWVWAWVGPVSWDTGGPPCMGTVGSTGGCVVVGPGSVPAAGLGGGEGVGVASALGSKESGSSFDILPKENNGFTRKIFVEY